MLNRMKSLGGAKLPKAILAPLSIKARWEITLLLLAFAVLVLVVITTAWLNERAQDGRDRTVALAHLSNKLGELHLYIRRAESDQRGYLLTNNQEFFDSYKQSVNSVMPRLTEIKMLHGADSQLLHAISQLQPKLKEKLEEMEEIIKLFAAGKQAGALRAVRSGQGQQLMEAIKVFFDDIQTRQSAELRAQLAHSGRLEWLLLVAELCGAVLVLGFSTLAVILLLRTNKSMRLAQQELGTAKDDLEITVAERTEQLRASNEEIQRFTYIVSHDLRAPLVNIMGFTTELENLRNDMLALSAAAKGDQPNLAANGEDAPPDKEEEALKREFDEAVGFIKTSIVKMERLIGAVLKMAREGERPLRPEPIDMTGLLQSIAAGLAHQTQEAGASIVIEPLPSITIDRLAVEQVFSNLLENAVKFLRADEPGRIQVTGKPAGRSAVFEVKDNGRGIELKDQRRIFELFRRAGPRDKPGEGIGLAYVLALLRRLGGSISADSEPGRGTVFTITLPMQWSGEEDKRASA